jgi:ribosome-associated protein
MSQTTTDSTRQTLGALVRALDAKKAGDPRVLDVREISTITDYLVIATGTSEPHLRALRVETEKALDAAGAPLAGMDTGGPGSGWLVVDAYQIMAHFFTEEKRAEFGLEKLWQDAREIAVATLLAPPKKPARRARKTPPKKAPKKASAKKASAKKTAPKKASPKASQKTAKKRPAKKR